MKPPKFVKCIRENDVTLALETDGDSGYGCVFMASDDEYMDISKPLTEKQLLSALAQAYQCGYEIAHVDSVEAVKRVLYERKTNHAPTAKIAKTIDYTMRWL